jgi:hypothetical protein
MSSRKLETHHRYFLCIQDLHEHDWIAQEVPRKKALQSSKRRANAQKNGMALWIAQHRIAG